MVLGATALFVGCAFDWDLPDDSPTQDGGGGSEAAPPVDAEVKDSAPMKGDGGVVDGGLAVCHSQADCAFMKQVCHFADYGCGKGDEAGTCIDVPDLCSSNDPVCGCTGKNYSSPCAAYGVPTDLAKSGCPFDAGTMFQCGPRYCDINKEYCLQGKGGDYSCKAPGVTTGACNPLTCACPVILSLPAGCTCSGTDGAVTVKGCP